MKPFARNIMFIGVLAVAASSMAVAQTSSSWFEQWYRATYGRPAPTEETRIAAEQANTPYREVAPPQATAPANAWFESWYGPTYGRPYPRELADIDAEEATTANREVPSSHVHAPRACKDGMRRMFLDARAPDLPPRYRNSEVAKMINDAMTPDDFLRLADYFDFRAMEFKQKSNEQLKELQRLLALPFHSRAYPTQVDINRELIKRYKAQADTFSARATTYCARSALDTEMVASKIAIARTSSSQFEQWYLGKFGRPSPTEVARGSAVKANTAYLEETPRQAVASANTWYEGWYRAKFGRLSPLEEMRLNDRTR